MEKEIKVTGVGPMFVRNLTDEEIKLIEEAKPTEPYLIKNVPDPELSYLTKKQRNQIIVPVRTEPKIGRNEKCPCGSNKKYKNCCLTT